MQIPIALIKPSDNPIRSSMDETKLNELAKSIAEHGVLEPIRVRPVVAIYPCTRHDWRYLEEQGFPGEDCTNCSELYWGLFEWNEEEEVEDNTKAKQPVLEIVFGHRRFEACQRAGLNAISGEIQWMDDEEAAVQAFIENHERDDTSPMDEARECKRWKTQFRWTQEEIAERLGISQPRVSQLLALVENESPEVQELLDTNYNSVITSSVDNISSEKPTEGHVRAVRKPLAERPDLKMPVLEKAQREGLTAKQTQNVAEAVMAAPTEQARDRLLEWNYSSNFHDKKRVAERTEKFGAHDPTYRDYTPSAVDEFKKLPSVKALLDELKNLGPLLDKVERVCEIEKASPEARLFIARRLHKWAQEFEQRAEAIHEQDIS